MPGCSAITLEDIGHVIRKSGEFAHIIKRLRDAGRKTQLLPNAIAQSCALSA